MFLRIISERVEPGEHACIALPGWLATACGWNGDLFKGFPLRFQIGSGIVVGRIEANMAEQPRVIMLAFYVIGNQSVVEWDPLLADVARHSAPDRRLCPPP